MSNGYSIDRLEKNLYRIIDKNVYAFLVEGTDRSMLLDAGFGTGNIADFVRRLTDKPVFLVNTHSDPDHIGGNICFNETRMHPAEFSRYKEKYMDLPKTAEHNCIAIPIWDGDIIDLGTNRFEVIHVPGHTPGSIALLDRENKILYSGDSVQRGSSVYMFGNGRDMEALIAGLKKLEEYADCIDVIYPSHGEKELPGSCIGELADAAENVVQGRVDGRPINPREFPFPMDALKYDVEGYGFLYKP